MENVFRFVSRIAGADVTKKRFAKLNSLAKVVNCDTRGESAFGVVTYTTTSGLMATVELAGLPLEVDCAGTVTVGEDVATDANGKAVTAAAGDVVIGFALTTATNAVVEIYPYPKAQSSGGIGSLTAVTADGAIAVPTRSMTYFITKAGVAAMTLVDPTATTHDGISLTFMATTANAHTLSNAAGSGFNAGGAGTDVGTFGGAKGDNITVTAYQGKWYVDRKTNVTLG